MIRTLSTFSLLLAIAGMTLLTVGCGEEPDLPTSIVISPEDFGADDTSFVRVTPDWSNANGYDWTNPNEIHVARDGYIYIADETDGGRVVRIGLDGSPIETDLFAEISDTSGRFPIGLGQDSKLNLYMVNGSNVVYARNTLLTDIGVREVITRFTVIDLETGEEYPVTDETPIYQQIDDLVDAGIDSITIDYETVQTSDDPALIAELTAPHVFIADTSGEQVSRFSDVDGGTRGEGFVYVADQGNDRIARFLTRQARILVLNDGNVTYQFVGTYAGDAIQAGQGQSSTNNPTSVVMTGSGLNRKMYFSQVDGNFLVQRMRSTGETWQFDIPATASGPPVIELDYFGAPVAIAAGETDDVGLGLFYVADSLQNRVTAFYPSGATFRHVGVERELIDLEPGQDLASALTSLGLDFYPDLNHDLIDFVAADEVGVFVDTTETLGEAMADAGYEFSAELNPDLSPDMTVVDPMTVDVLIPVEKTVEVYFPTLSQPRGVATREGVVFIADSGNDQIVRFRRTDTNEYIPNDPNFP